MPKLKFKIIWSTVTLVALTLAVGFWFTFFAPQTAPVAANGEQVYFERFQKQIWPLLTRGGEQSCVGCHDAESRSELHFFTDAESSYKMLLEKGYFATNSPDALLSRIGSANPKTRMPKGQHAKPWAKEEVQTLRAYLGDLGRHLKSTGQSDEQFPTALMAAYRGPVPDAMDNQFISYRQLRGKIETIFHDDGKRNDRDLFAENVAMFGGADFKERFNESTKASATFLSALESLSRDVAARAYAQRTGPFAGRAKSLPSPVRMAKPDGAYEKEIRRLYQTILFRPPTAHELQQSFVFLQSVYRAGNEIRSNDFELAFQVTAEDGSTGLKASRTITIPVSGEARGLYQEYVDQSDRSPVEEDPAEEAKPPGRRGRKVSGQTARHKLSRAFLFKTNDPGQCVKISNVNTIGNVSFHAIELQPAGNPDTNQIVRITATNASVQAEGAWKVEDRRGLTSFEDENNDKGSSAITIPIQVPQEGQYDITICWRQNNDNASAVITEVFSHDETRLMNPPLPKAPPGGEAHYFIDETADTVAFADLETSFQFGPDDYVEINNQGTRNRVTADAVKFAAGKTSFLVDNDEADGREQWKVYDSGQFKAYNQTGKNTYHDENARKGELALRYKPSIRTNEFKAGVFYRVHVGYPAKRDHEFHTPVIVKAQKSSPIIQMAYPPHGRAEAAMEIDASASYTVQGGRLKFTWQQTDGPAVTAGNWNEPVLKFTAPRQSVEQIAWEGLTRALMRHPDFLFTRPPSLERAKDQQERRRLQLVKMALDLVGRPPAKVELDKLGNGVSLAKMVDDYLQTQEFKDFYFHRVRLYVESHGTETQDEPARLWCLVAFNDRPFQEILTADYTVDARFQRQPRPAHHGRTGVLTTAGFIEGKPGLPHFNYAAQVAELFLGYIFEVPPEVVAQREGITAVATTDPGSLCYSCHKILTPLAFQRNRWDDDGRYRTHDDYGLPIDDGDQKLVASYPFKGDGLEAFALQAVKKERFIRTIINTHFTFYFGRDMRYQQDERGFYRRLWNVVHKNNFTIRSLIKAMLTSPEYLEGRPQLKSTEKIARQGQKEAVDKLHAGLSGMTKP